MQKDSSKKKKIIVAVSGGFDPIHVGHIRMFEQAKNLGDELVVILNNDNWLKKKKGFVFIPQDERKEIIESIKRVDRVIITKHGHIPEVSTCKKINCKMVFNVGKGGKIQSSSWLLENFLKSKNDYYI